MKKINSLPLYFQLEMEIFTILSMYMMEIIKWGLSIQTELKQQVVYKDFLLLNSVL